MRLRMTYQVDVDPHGVSSQQLEDYLAQIMEGAEEDGLITRDSFAEIRVTPGGSLLSATRVISWEDPEPLLHEAKSLGLGEGDLDEYVHEAFAEDAASVNNSGLDEQIEELCSRYGTVETRRLLQAAAAQKE